MCILYNMLNMFSVIVSLFKLYRYLGRQIEVDTIFLFVCFEKGYYIYLRLSSNLLCNLGRSCTLILLSQPPSARISGVCHHTWLKTLNFSDDYIQEVISVLTETLLFIIYICIYKYIYLLCTDLYLIFLQKPSTIFVT